MIKKENRHEKESADSQQAFLKIYEEYKRLLYWAAGRCTESPELREDFVQEGVSRLLPKTERIRWFKSRVLATYLATTVRNISSNHYRKAAQEAIYLADEDISAFEDEFALCQENGERSVEDAALLRVQAEELRKVLTKLSEKEQILLRGKYQLYLSDRELSQQLQCNPDSIRMMLTRARRHAFALLAEEGFEYETT